MLPNGHQAESPHSREIFSDVIKACDITLVYVSGRDRALLEEAIEQYRIPVPAYAIGDVGTSIYRINDSDWQPLPAWTDLLQSAWSDDIRRELLDQFNHRDELRLQEAHKQGPYKISFYTEPRFLDEASQTSLHALFEQYRSQLSIITSVDETTHTGLVDILPLEASKYHAIRFLLEQLGRDHNRVMFAGDSGNDLAVISSEIRSVLVNNALDSIKQQARSLSAQAGLSDACFIAAGNWHGLNGNYTAGILEGLCHYFPEYAATIKSIIQQYATR